MATRYAFGQDECDGHECPARTFGFRPIEVNDVIALYDNLLGAKTGIGWGTVEPKRALETWKDAIAEAKENNEEPRHIRRAERILNYMENELE